MAAQEGGEDMEGLLVAPLHGGLEGGVVQEPHGEQDRLHCVGE